MDLISLTGLILYVCTVSLTHPFWGEHWYIYCLLQTSWNKLNFIRKKSILECYSLSLFVVDSLSATGIHRYRKRTHTHTQKQNPIQNISQLGGSYQYVDIYVIYLYRENPKFIPFTRPTSLQWLLGDITILGPSGSGRPDCCHHTADPTPVRRRLYGHTERRSGSDVILSEIPPWNYSADADEGTVIVEVLHSSDFE